MPHCIVSPPSRAAFVTGDVRADQQEAGARGGGAGTQPLRLSVPVAVESNTHLKWPARIGGRDNGGAGRSVLPDPTSAAETT
jgi:hypothetical protein